MKVSNNPIGRYLSDTFGEWSKITWPTKEQAALLTAITVAVSIFTIILIAVSDLGLSQGYQALLGLFS